MTVPCTCTLFLAHVRALTVTGLQECKAALSDERKQKEQMSADREASNEALGRVRQV